MVRITKRSTQLPFRCARCMKSRATFPADNFKGDALFPLAMHKQEIRFRAGNSSQGFLQHVWSAYARISLAVAGSVCCCRTTHSSGHSRPPSCLCRLTNVRLDAVCFRSSLALAVNQQTLAAHLTETRTGSGDPSRLMRVFPSCQTVWRHRNFGYRISNPTME